MSFLSTGTVNYKSRIARAETLASKYEFASEMLHFYAAIARFQGEFYERLPKLWGKRPRIQGDGNLRSHLILPILVEPFRRYLSLIEAKGPAPLAGAAHELSQASQASWADLLEEFWKVGLLEALENQTGDPMAKFLARAFLIPYAEFLVGGLLPPVLPMTVCRCPRCSSLPLLGVLRPEGDGGKRYLQCSFCSQEWEFRRILCAHCGETEESKLPVYIAEQFPHVRVEGCETCKHFLRTIDLTRDGNAVPLVDDLAAIPLSLWAEENSYKRIQTNLLGT